MFYSDTDEGVVAGPAGDSPAHGDTSDTVLSKSPQLAELNQQLRVGCYIVLCGNG